MNGKLLVLTAIVNIFVGLGIVDAAPLLNSKTPAPGDSWKEPLTGMPFVWVPAGCFQMGCQPDDDSCTVDEKPRHEVCLNGYWIGKYEVTQQEWKEIEIDNPSHHQVDDDYPLEQASWVNIQQFINNLNETNDNRYIFRLPTEAEWEYACRGGNNEQIYSGGNDILSLGWHWTIEETNKQTYPIGQKKPNSLGIYDMSGNVWEWTADLYDDEAYQQNTTRHNPQVTGKGSCRVARGGSYHSYPKRLRCSARRAYPRKATNRYTGFRLVREKRPHALPAYTTPAMNGKNHTTN